MSIARLKTKLASPPFEAAQTNAESITSPANIRGLRPYTMMRWRKARVNNCFSLRNESLRLRAEVRSGRTGNGADAALGSLRDDGPHPPIATRSKQTDLNILFSSYRQASRMESSIPFRAGVSECRVAMAGLKHEGATCGSRITLDAEDASCASIVTRQEPVRENESSCLSTWDLHMHDGALPAAMPRPYAA